MTALLFLLYGSLPGHNRTRDDWHFKLAVEVIKQCKEIDCVLEFSKEN